MKDYNNFISGFYNYKFTFYHNHFLNEYTFFYLNEISLSVKQIYPILNVLFENSYGVDLNKKEFVKTVITSLCYVLNENESTKTELFEDCEKKPLVNKFTEVIKIILDLYKNFFKNDYYINILKYTRNFLLYSVVIYEFIKQNSFTVDDFIEKYSDRKMGIEKEKISKTINNLKQK